MDNLTSGILSKIFPHCICNSEWEIYKLVHALVDARLRDHSSSFALTMDAPKGQWNLWLSDISYEFLKEFTSAEEADIG